MFDNIKANPSGEEWLALIERLSEKNEPVPPMPLAVEPAFEDAVARKRVGVLITKAVFGEPLYSLYQIYCGDPLPRP